MSAFEALTIWAEYSEFGRLRSARRGSSGAAEGYDYAKVVTLHVERFWQDQAEGYRKVCLHRCLGLPNDTFRWRGPGETKSRALLVMGWGRHLNSLDVVNDAFKFAIETFQDWYESNPMPEYLPSKPTLVLSKDEENAIARARRARDEFDTVQAAKHLGMEQTAVCNLLSRGHLYGWKYRGRWVTTRGACDEMKNRRVAS